MKQSPFVLVCAMAGAAAVVLAQQASKDGDASGVTFADKAKIEAALDKGGPAMSPRAALVSRNDDELVAGGRRDAPGVAERHEKAYDIVYITEGEATYVTGGTLKDSKETGPGEMLGGTIDGGETHQLKAGDVIVVPPGVPHWWKDTKGVRYLIVKVNQH